MRQGGDIRSRQQPPDAQDRTRNAPSPSVPATALPLRRTNVIDLSHPGEQLAGV
jgi:hypothetical protein